MEEETQSVPSAEVGASEPMSFDAALSILNAADEAPVEGTTAASEASADEGQDVEAGQADASTQEEEATSEAEPEAELVLHGNAKTRLRNGQEVTISELKKRWDEAEEYKAKLPEIEAREREFEQKQQAIAAQEQQTLHLIQQAKAVLQANFPPKPDYAAVQRGELDIITYQEQVAAYNHAAEKWHGLNRAEQARTEQTKREQAEANQQRIQKEIQLLKDAVPETRTEEGFKAFREEILTHAPKFGFSAEEIGNLADHRHLRVLKAAIAYEKLQAEKAKVAAKVKDAPPVQVQAPGRRVSPTEQKAAQVKQQFDRLRKTGSFDDALAILNAQD
ncbi:hypothetical protein [Microvirga lotononidis]|uniref:Scaffolding protein n=1 Tax=Microvirga lotononidis TaxID=864069 RepID=I4YP53_9HYPH|nr:hypothetical protein [Microvirga lotononidis]EIM25745.1 hypothetical protein MicloDRAFT_00064720 [Microvirga lotononidis]WQO25674.1 hypothetical protein U0023_13200 [Microvirga lotononidis]